MRCGTLHLGCSAGKTAASGPQNRCARRACRPNERLGSRRIEQIKPGQVGQTELVVGLGDYQKFARSGRGEFYDVWVQPRGSAASWNVRWTSLAGRIGKMLHRHRFPDQFWVCAQRRRALARRWRYGPWTGSEARSMVDTLTAAIEGTTWDPRSENLRPAGFQRRLPGGGSV